jgi:predicted metal-dependent hydrolase
MISPIDNEAFARGLDLFNRAHFFDAHEVLEDVWRALPRDLPAHQRLRLHAQGVVQLAVAFHHQSKGNGVGARSVLERALRNLDGAELSFPDLDFDRLRAELALWQRYYLDDSEITGERKLGGPHNRGHKPSAVPPALPPAFPKITRRR